MGPDSAIAGYYDYRLVLLSVLIAVLSAYTALDLAGRVTASHGRTRAAWLVGGSAAMGSGIWAMHYIGMAAFHLTVPVLYDWPMVLLSLLAAIAAAGIALITVSQPKVGVFHLLCGSFLMGSGIAAMHYIGMEAMRLPAMCKYSPFLVLLSIFLAICFSYVALKLAFGLREAPESAGLRKLAAAIAIGLAIATMHYVGMAAASFYPSRSLSDPNAVSVNDLGLTSIAVISVLLLAIVLLSSFVDRRFALQQGRLAESESQLQTVFENLNEGVLVFDCNGRVVMKNNAAVRLLSISDESVSYEGVARQFDAFSMSGHPLQRAELPIAMALRGEYVQDYEILYRHTLTGESGAQEISSAPVNNSSGEARLVILTYRDITQRRQQDEARKRLAAIVESSEDAIISKDMLGTITSWNPGAEKIFGYTEAEMMGQSVIRIFPDDRLFEEVEIMSRIGRGETFEHAERLRKTKDGKLIHVSVTTSPIRDSNGAVIGASTIARNISERKELESQLLQAQKMEAVGQLAAGIAHEINTPIQYVGDNTNFLKESWIRLALLLDAAKALRDNVSPATIQQSFIDRFDACCKAADVEYLSQDIPRAIDQTLDGVQRVAKIVRAMKDFSHPGTQEKRAIDLNNAIETTVTISRHEWKYIAEIRTQLDPHLQLVPCLAADINQVLLNLVVNATHAIADSLSADGGETGLILISTQQDGDWAEISVSDNGTGIPEHIRSRVFDPFFTTKDVGKGTGQGLMLAHTVIVKKHAGKIWFESEVGKGTTFFVRLPLLIEEEI